MDYSPAWDIADRDIADRRNDRQKGFLIGLQLAAHIARAQHPDRKTSPVSVPGMIANSIEESAVLVDKLPTLFE